MALAQGDEKSVPALETAVREASLNRENAVARYRHHQTVHAKGTGRSAASGSSSDF